MTINNVKIERSRVTHLVRDAPPMERVTVYFEDGNKLVFTGTTADEVWRAFEIKE